MNILPSTINYRNTNVSLFFLFLYFHEVEPNPIQAPIPTRSRDMSFEEILDEKPTLDELCEYVPINTKWHLMGIQLKLKVKKLNEIEELQGSSTYKMSKMYELWLDTNPQATRRQIVETLKMDLIEEITLALNYESKLKELFVVIGESARV